MGKENNPGTPWTPEYKNQMFKEIVTAILAVLIVLFTLILAGKAFLLAGDETKIGDAKDILQILVGISGVVIGYYFGRVPAEAHAAKAQEQADAANAQSEVVSAQAQVIADQVDQVMDKMSTVTAVTRGGDVRSAGSQTMEDLQKVRDDLKKLSISGRRR